MKTKKCDTCGGVFVYEEGEKEPFTLSIRDEIKSLNERVFLLFVVEMVLLFIVLSNL